MYKHIYEHPKAIEYLEKRNLLSQYKKTKKNILLGIQSGAKLKIRQPKKDGVYYFRINKQFRAIVRKKEDSLFVIDIDNHS